MRKVSQLREEGCDDVKASYSRRLLLPNIRPHGRRRTDQVACHLGPQSVSKVYWWFFGSPAERLTLDEIKAGPKRDLRSAFGESQRSATA